MAAELLQLLEFAKGAEDQAATETALQQHAQAIVKHENTIDEYSGYIRQHAGIIDQHTATIQQQAQDIRILRAERAGDAWLLHAQFGILLATIFVIGLAGILWSAHLQKRIKQLESIINRSSAAAIPETEPTARR